MRYTIEVEDAKGIWTDVRGNDGNNCSTNAPSPAWKGPRACLKVRGGPCDTRIIATLSRSGEGRARIGRGCTSMQLYDQQRTWPSMQACYSDRLAVQRSP